MTHWKEEDPNNWCSLLTTRYLDLRYWILQKLVYNDALFSAAARVHKLFYEIIIEISIGAGPWLKSLFHLCHFGGMIVCTISQIGDATTLLPIRRCCLKTEYVKIPTANALPAQYFYSPIDHQISKNNDTIQQSVFLSHCWHHCQVRHRHWWFLCSIIVLQLRLPES